MSNNEEPLPYTIEESSPGVVSINIHDRAAFEALPADQRQPGVIMTAYIEGEPEKFTLINCGTDDGMECLADDIDAIIKALEIHRLLLKTLE